MMNSVMKNKAFRTISVQSETELTERRSVFLGYACPVETEAAALDFINEVKRKHGDATHNVYAYMLRDNNISRFSDDGEPHGTAGLPVMEVMRKEKIINAAVVVTRYFGGILLGAGGLVRAYSASAKQALDAAKPVFSVPFALFELCCEYADFQRLSRFFDLSGTEILNTLYSESVAVSACIREDEFDSVPSKVADLTNGRVAVNYTGTAYRPDNRQQ